MADYKAIHGKNILHVASDLDNAEGEGQIWFNTTSSDYKTIVKVAGAWATSTAINSARSLGGGMGSSTAAVFVGGTAPPSDTLVSLTEEWNGSAWTEVTNIPTAVKNTAAGGTLTAGWVGAGDATPDGSPPYAVESYEYDGTNWADGGDVNTGRNALMGSGPQTACFVAGGFDSAVKDEVETYDGSSWTEVADINTARGNFGASGNSTTGLIFGGTEPPYTVNVESWNGTAWTEGNNLNAARSRIGLGGGTSPGTQGLAVSGYNPPVVPARDETELYDGTSWTEVADLNSGRSGGSIGTTGSNSALYFGGDNPNSTWFTASEEWDFDSTLAAGAWASGGALNTG